MFIKCRIFSFKYVSYIKSGLLFPFKHHFIEYFSLAIIRVLYENVMKQNQYTVILQANNLETSILYHFLCYMKLYFVMYSLYIVQFFIYRIFLKDFVDLNHPIRMFIQCIIYIHTVKTLICECIRIFSSSYSLQRNKGHTLKIYRTFLHQPSKLKKRPNLYSHPMTKTNLTL